MTPPAAPTHAPALIAVAHGTRDQAGVREVQRLVELVRQARPDVPVRLCWLELAEPLLRNALPGITGPVVVVPLLLSTGYHVKTDITAVLGDRPDTAVANQLGPDSRITAVVLARMREAGAVTGAGVALFASGSSDPEAAENLAEVAAQLQRQAGCRVYPRFLTDKRWRDGLPDGVQVANYLFAPGYFNDQLRSSVGAGLNLHRVPEPIGAHPAVVEVILDRYDEAVGSLAR
ncbi:MAG TPA: sirohydrochlorin chelatase [Jatrophihabitans sp.]|jgi:sirohydrochlorin ferrochelatase|uniref:sirohydrochlorin chelatase n=1 Tax=Jatrophihabitans sp. TaxID=1932789 RepID=UPI002F13FFD5